MGINGTISISENVAQNMYVYPNVTELSINVIGKSFMDFSYSDISWRVNNSNNITSLSGTYNYKTLIDASYLIPYNADNIQLSLKVTYSPSDNSADISKILIESRDVVDTTFYPIGTLDISGINIINANSKIIVQPNIDNIDSKPIDLDISYNQIKWTIKGTDISFGPSGNYNKNTLPDFSFTKDNIMHWKSISDAHPKSQINGMPQIRLSVDAIDINKSLVFSKNITTQFVEISGNIFENQTISPNVLYADDSTFTNIQYNVYDYNGNEKLDLSKNYIETFNKDNIHDASFLVPDAPGFGYSDDWTIDKRPTVKLSIDISNQGASRNFEITNNILFTWDDNITSINSYLDLSGVIILDNVTQGNIIKQSTIPSSTNLSSLITTEGFFISPIPTTIYDKCTINYNKFIEWGKHLSDASFSDASKNIIVESIGNNWHIDFCYNVTNNNSTILSLSFEHLFTGINNYRNRTTTRIANIQYKYILLGEAYENISNSHYPGVYSQDNIHDAFLDVKNINLIENIKETTRLQITYDIYELNKENKKTISRIYDYNLVHFQNDSSHNSLIPSYLVGGQTSEPQGSLDFSSIYQINNKILWPTNIIYIDATKLSTTVNGDVIFFDNIKFTLSEISTSNNNREVSYGDNYFTLDNISDISFELFDNLANDVNNGYNLKVNLTAYSLGERDIEHYTKLSKNAFTEITRGTTQDKSKFKMIDLSYSQDFSAVIPFDGKVKVKVNENSSIKDTIKPNDNIYPYVNDLSFGRFGGDNSQRITYDNIQWQFVYDNFSKKYEDTWWGNGVEFQTGNIDINKYDLSKTELWNLKNTDASYGKWGYWMNYYDNIYNSDNIKNAFFKVPIDSVGKLQVSMRVRYNNSNNNFSQNKQVPANNIFSTFAVNSMSAGGDPMIMTINGDMYKMSNFNGYSRMLQGTIHNKPIFINVETTESTKEECLEASAWVKNQLKDDLEFNNVPEETYLDYDEAFMRKLWLSYNGCEMLIDMDKQRILNNTFDDIKIYANDEKHIFPFYKNQEIPETIEIRLPNLGKLFVGYYDNPQIRTCFQFESEVDIVNAGGAIVHCLNAESIQIPSLTSTEFIHSHGNDECKYVIQYAVVTTNDESEKEITNINCY